MADYQSERFPLPTPGRLRRELGLRRPPWWIVVGLIVLIIATWVPLYPLYKMRTSYSDKPKIHFVQDMDIQPGFRAQEAHPMFADGRAARAPVAGTVARGHLQLDDHFFRGYRTINTAGDTPEGTTGTIEFFDEMPASLAINDELLARGHERYGIYCSLCHDDQGLGNGIIHQRAVALKADSWVPPTNLMTQEMRDRVDGQLFQAIGDGVRNMPSYATQISPTDRWAIVAWVRHLQQNSPVAPPTTAATSAAINAAQTGPLETEQ